MPGDSEVGRASDPELDALTPQVPTFSGPRGSRFRV